MERNQPFSGRMGGRERVKGKTHARGSVGRGYKAKRYLRKSPNRGRDSSSVR